MPTPPPAHATVSFGIAFQPGLAFRLRSAPSLRVARGPFVQAASDTANIINTMPVEIPEVAPIRFDADDAVGFKAHLTEHGCAFAPAARRNDPSPR